MMLCGIILYIVDKNAKSNTSDEVLKYMEYDYEHLLEKCEKLLK